MITSIQSAEKIEALLLDMLAPMRGNEDTLLHFEIDSHAIAKSVWISFVSSLSPQEARQWEDWPTIESSLSNLVNQVLACQSDSAAIHNKTSQAPLSSPALWLERLITTMRGIDQRSLEILALCIEGFNQRDISEELETGLRCIKRIMREMQFAWDEQASTPE